MLVLYTGRGTRPSSLPPSRPGGAQTPRPRGKEEEGRGREERGSAEGREGRGRETPGRRRTRKPRHATIVFAKHAAAALAVRNASTVNGAAVEVDFALQEACPPAPGCCFKFGPRG